MREGSRRQAGIALRLQLTEYALGQEAELTRASYYRAKRTVHEILSDVRSIQDPEERAITRTIGQHLLEQHQANQGGAIRTTMAEVDNLLSRQFPSPQPPRTLLDCFLDYYVERYGE